MTFMDIRNSGAVVSPYRTGSFVRKERTKETDFKELWAWHVYGTNTRKIYEQGCKVFGWDPEKADCFGGQGKRLYAEECDLDGAGVWFICYSNYNHKHTIVDDEHVCNVISDDRLTITETIKDTDNNPAKPSNYKKRIVFVKTGQGYHFLGVYEVVTFESTKRVHRRISDHYPLV